MDVYEQLRKPGRVYCIVMIRNKERVRITHLNVFDITEIPYRQVGKYRDNKISPMVYPNIIYQIGMRYNTVWTLVEVNDVGQQVNITFWTWIWKYYDVFYDGHGQKIGGGFGKK